MNGTKNIHFLPQCRYMVFHFYYSTNTSTESLVFRFCFFFFLFIFFVRLLIRLLWFAEGNKLNVVTLDERKLISSERQINSERKNNTKWVWSTYLNMWDREIIKILEIHSTCQRFLELVITLLWHKFLIFLFSIPTLAKHINDKTINKVRDKLKINYIFNISSVHLRQR